MVLSRVGDTFHRMKNRLLLSLVWASLALACGAASGPHPRSNALASSPRPKEPSLRVRWLGGPTATLERGHLRVLTDPMLGPRAENAFVLPKHPSSGALNAPIARYTSPPALDVGALSAILISHTHNDHFDAEARRVLPKGLPVVVAAAGAETVRAAGFVDVRPLDWGEQLTLQKGEVQLQIVAVPAHHAHDAQLDHDLGRGNGYILTWKDAAGSLRAYWTGDAVLADDSRELAARYGAIDLLLPHMGAVGSDGGLGLRTMNADETLTLTARIAPRLVIPIHHTTFGHYREPIVALEQRVAEASEQKRFRFLAEGQTFDVE